MKYLIWVILILLIFVRYFTSRPVYHDGDRVRISASVFSDPLIYPSSQSIKIAGLRTYLPALPEISYGDRVVVEGIVAGEKLTKAKLISVKSGGILPGFRNKIISFYMSVLPQPMAGLTAGIILGSKGTLTAEFWNMVKSSGVAHVVVASGTNVTFVVSFLFGLTALFLPRRYAIPIVIFGIILYLFMSGFEAPLIRAAVMSLVAFGAQETGRLVGSWRIFLLTVAGMLIYWPDWIGDIGFILTFVSTASIMIFQPRIVKLVKSLPEVIKTDFSTTLAAQIGVTPILFVTFGQFNVWSPLANLLVLWTIPFIMILGSLGGILGLAFPVIGKIILWMSYPLTWWFSVVVSIFS